MSHLYAARCTVCGEIDDPICPECRTSAAVTHGTKNQDPFTNPPHADGYRHEWHPDCIGERPSSAESSRVGATPAQADEVLDVVARTTTVPWPDYPTHRHEAQWEPMPDAWGRERCARCLSSQQGGIHV